MGEIAVRVVPPPDRVGELGGTSLSERFADRVEELGGSLGQIATTLRARLEAELSDQKESEWKLSEVALAFSLDLEAEAGVVVAKARTSAGFEATLTWKRE
jgi:hypothetical protein